jgi:uncharacterized membrane protein YeiH
LISNDQMEFDVFWLMNVAGLVAFATVGSLKGIDGDLDLLGVAVLGVTTALGGGTIRDLLVNAVPHSLHSTTDVSVALVGVALAIAGARRVDGLARHPVVLLADAVGLAAFATTGALVAAEAGLSPFGVVALATITAVGGGAIADVLLGNTPFVLKEDFYATCAVLGGVAFWILSTNGFSEDVAAVACAAVVLTLRLVALRRRWRLPTVDGVLVS